MKKTILIASLLFFCISTIKSQVDLKKGLIAYYPFDGNTNDLSGNGHNGTIHGGVSSTTDRLGIPNKAYKFDGSSGYIRVPNAPDLNPKNITISVWVKTNNSYVGNGNDPIVDKPYTSHTSPYYQYKLGITGDLYSNTPGSTAFWVSSSSNYTQLTTETAIYPVQKWFNLLASYDSDTLKIYVDGVLKSSIKTSISMVDFNQDLFIGTNWTVAVFLNASLDELKIYNRALNISEVQAIAKDINPPTITFNPISTKTYGDPTVTLSATSTNNSTPVKFTSSDPSIASCTGTNGETVTLLKAGTCKIFANQTDAAQVEQTLVVLPKPILITADALSKVYGSTDPTLSYQLSSPLIGTDKMSGQMIRTAGENVGTYPINQGTLSAGSNYSISFVSANFTITPIKLNIDLTGINADKIYDGNTNASFNVPPHLLGVLAGDANNVKLVIPAISFSDKSIGSNKPLSYANFSLTGSAISNYTLNQPQALTANITKANLTFSFIAQNKAYDGNTIATADISIQSGLVSGDLITMTSSVAKFDTKDAGIGKTVTSEIQIIGTDAGNYNFSTSIHTKADITPIPLSSVISASPDLTYVKGRTPMVFTALFSPNIILAEQAPLINLVGAGLNIHAAMIKQDNFTWTYVWTPPAVGVGEIAISASVPDPMGNFVQTSTGRVLILIDNVPPTMTFDDDSPTNLVRGGNTVNCTATFKAETGIDESITPVITIGDLVVKAKMSKTNNLVWTYQWQVPVGVNAQEIVSVIAFDNQGTQVYGGENLTVFTIDNTPPVISFPNKERPTVHVFNPRIIQFNEPIKLTASDINSSIELREGGSTGELMPFKLQASDFNNAKPQISIAANFKCSSTYFLSVKSNMYTDLAGNPNLFSDTTFTTDSNPEQPIITGSTTATNGNKYCPGDALTYSYKGNSTLSYQWRMAGQNISGQTNASYELPENLRGTLSLLVTNTATSCTAASDEFSVNINPIVRPTFTISKEAGVSILLKVNNTANRYLAYQWFKGDGSEIGSELQTNRQFIGLPGAYAIGTYKVLATDINGCKAMSESKTMKSSEPALLLYPTVNEGSFKIVFIHEYLGMVKLRIFNPSGIPLKLSTYEKSENAAMIDIDMKGLTPGAYTLEVSIRDFVERAKFIVQ